MGVKYVAATAAVGLSVGVLVSPTLSEADTGRQGESRLDVSPHGAGAGRDGQLLLSAGAETGDTSQWCFDHSAVEQGVGASTFVAREGLFSYRVEVRDNELIYDSERSEFANGPGDCDQHRYRPGDETWTALSVYPATLPRYSSWSNLAQFKEPHGGSPPVSITLANDQIVFRAKYSPGTAAWALGPIQRGQWHDFIVHTKWSSNPEVGFVEVYYQGELVVPKTKARTMEPGSEPLFLSVGHYRDKSNRGAAVVYVDSIKVGTSKKAVSPSVPREATERRGTSGALSGDAGGARSPR